MPTNIVPLPAGTPTVIDSVLERQGVPRVKWLDDDGSEFRGYQLPDGRLIGSCFVVSPARQAVLDAANAASASLENKDAVARTIIVNQVAATRPKMPPPIGNGTATAQERWLMALSWLLYRQE